MSRLRDWAPATYAEIYLRLSDYGQSVAHVARVTGMSHMQITHFKNQLDLAGPTGALPPNRQTIDDVILKLVSARLAESIPNEPPPRKSGRPRKVKPVIDEVGLDQEVAGCIALAHEVAKAFPGVTARAFLHQCLTDARSMG